MQPKLLKTELGEFSAPLFTGGNESGYVPVGDRVLVLPDQGSEQTSGGIFLDQETLERITAAAETGILVACGDEAFVWNSDRRRKWEGQKPQIGQRIYFERYAGALIRGDDGKTYRVFDDKCIAALRSDAVAAPTVVTAAPISEAQARAQQDLDALAAALDAQFAGRDGQKAAIAETGEPYVTLAIGGLLRDGFFVKSEDFREVPSAAVLAWKQAFDDYAVNATGKRLYWRRRPVLYRDFESDKWQVKARLLLTSKPETPEATLKG